MRFYPEVRRGRTAPQSIERRTKEWYEDTMDDQHSDVDLSKRIYQDMYYRIVGDSGMNLKIFLSLAPFGGDRVISPQSIVDRYEHEVLRPTGYQIIDTDFKYIDDGKGVTGPSVLVVVVDLRLRSDMVEKPRYLYHLTKSTNEDRIMHKGLIPKQGPGDSWNAKYKNRIYFRVKTGDWESIVEHDVVGSLGDLHFIVIRVDTNLFDKFNIFEDREFVGNERRLYVWTPTHIPAYALDVVFDSSE